MGFASGVFAVGSSIRMRCGWVQSVTMSPLARAIAIGSGGHNISEAEALKHVYGYAVALDMTRRDLQKALSSKGSPWDVAKAFDESCPCGTVYQAAAIGHLKDGRITLGAKLLRKRRTVATSGSARAR